VTVFGAATYAVVPIGIMAASMVAEMTRSVLVVLTSSKSRRSFAPLFPLLALHTSQVAWGYATGFALWKSDPCLVILAIGLTFSNVVVIVVGFSKH
jgi:hypothetical protein